MNEVFNLFITEIGSWVSWLSSWSLFGIPFLYYLLGFILAGIIMEFVFG